MNFNFSQYFFINFNLQSQLSLLWKHRDYIINSDSNILNQRNINNSDEKMSNITEIIGEYFIFSNTHLIETIKNFVYKHAKKYNVTITDIHKQTNEFILTVDSNETNKMFFYTRYPNDKL